MDAPQQFTLKPKYGLWINGEEVDAISGKTFDIENPEDGSIFTTVAEGDKEDIELALDAAHAAFDSGVWSEMPARERGRIMMKAAQLLRDRLDYIISIEVLSTGRAVKEMKAQIPRVAEWLEYFGALGQVCPLPPMTH